MKAELLGVDSPHWTSFLETEPHDFYHLPAYVAVSASRDGGEPHALHVLGGGRRMLLPIVVRPIPNGGQDATSPYGYPGPLASGPDEKEFMQDALAAGTHLLRSNGIISLFVRLHPLLNLASFDRVGEVVTGGEVVSIDLTASEEELWRHTRAGHRSQISQALRAGRTAAFDDSWLHLAAFKNLYRANMARVSAADYYLFDDAYFDGLRRALGDRLRLCVVNIDGDLAAGALFVETCGIVQFHLSATDPAFGREGLMKLIIHFVRSWGKARGNLELHLGGGVGAADDSLLRFKSGFSPRRFPFRTLRVIVDPVEYTRRVERPGFGAPAAEGSDFFPAYRLPTS